MLLQLLRGHGGGQLDRAHQSACTCPARSGPCEQVHFGRAPGLSVPRQAGPTSNGFAAAESVPASGTPALVPRERRRGICQRASALVAASLCSSFCVWRRSASSAPKTRWPWSRTKLRNLYVVDATPARVAAHRSRNPPRGGPSLPYGCRRPSRAHGARRKPQNAHRRAFRMGVRRVSVGELYPDGLVVAHVSNSSRFTPRSSGSSSRRSTPGVAC